MNIKSDDSGFLIGTRRLAELKTGLSDVQDKTAEILSLLYALIELDAKERQQQGGERDKIIQAISVIAKKPQKVELVVTSAGGVKTKATGGKVTLNAGAQSAGVGQSTRTTKTSAVVAATGQNTARDASGRFTSQAKTTVTEAKPENARDASGRFTSSAKTINDRASFIESVKRGIETSSNLSPDVGGLDPTVDALRELHGVFSPAGRAFGLMGRGASWLFKKAKPKKVEDIPRVQQDHQTEVERHNYEQRKLFKKLIDAVNRQNGSGIMSKLAALASLLAALAGKGGVDIGRNGRNGRNAPPIPVPNKGKPTGPDKGKPTGPDKAGNPSKLGRMLGKVPVIGSLLGAGVLASQWSDMSISDKGGSLGAMTGGAIGSVVGSIAGPFGAVGGGFAGAHIGEKIGQKVGEWTGSLKNQDIGGSIVTKWNDTVDGIDKLIKYSWLKTLTMGGMSGGFMRTSLGGFGGTGGQSTAGSIKSSSTAEQDANQSKVYNAMIKAGFQKEQALALTAEVGRENSYNSKHLFGSHRDEANGKTNIGMISWQGTRATKLYNRMKEQGLINPDGTMVQSQAALDAQAKFMYEEIHNNKQYNATKQAFSNPNVKAEDLSRVLGKNYIGWAYGQDTLSSGKAFDWKKHDRVRRGHLENIERKVNTGSAAPKSGTVLVGTKAQVANTARPVHISGSSAVKPVQVAQPPSVKKQESKSAQPIWASNRDSITQAPSDRDLLHAITGGMGMRTITA